MEKNGIQKNKTDFIGPYISQNIGLYINYNYVVVNNNNHNNYHTYNNNNNNQQQHIRQNSGL